MFAKVGLLFIQLFFTFIFAGYVRDELILANINVHLANAARNSLGGIMLSILLLMVVIMLAKKSN